MNGSEDVDHSRGDGGRKKKIKGRQKCVIRRGCHLPVVGGTWCCSSRKKRKGERGGSGRCDQRRDSAADVPAIKKGSRSRYLGPSAQHNKENAERGRIKIKTIREKVNPTVPRVPR